MFFLSGLLYEDFKENIDFLLIVLLLKYSESFSNFKEYLLNLVLDIVELGDCNPLVILLSCLFDNILLVKEKLSKLLFVPIIVLCFKFLCLLNLYKLSRQRNLKHRTIIGTNNNLDSFSLTNNILSKRHDNKITSGLQSPNSTMSKTRFKRYSLKLENDSLYFSNNTMRRKSIFSLKSSYNRPERKNKERKKTKAIIEEVFSGQPNFIKLSLSENQRQFHQRIYLRNLRSQIDKFEESDQFYANEGQIRSNAILPNKFQRDIFVRQIKKASFTKQIIH